MPLYSSTDATVIPLKAGIIVEAQSGVLALRWAEVAGLVVTWAEPKTLQVFFKDGSGHKLHFAEEGQLVPVLEAYGLHLDGAE